MPRPQTNERKQVLLQYSRQPSRDPARTSPGIMKGQAGGSLTPTALKERHYEIEDLHFDVSAVRHPLPIEYVGDDLVGRPVERMALLPNVPQYIVERDAQNGLRHRIGCDA